MYLTLGDQPSGVYHSQVEDLVDFLNEDMNRTVRLVSFISIRGFWKNRKQIKRSVRYSMVLPMFPSLGNWRRNQVILDAILYLLKPKTIFSRGVFASALAISSRKRGLVDEVVYDGRGAIAAEWTEYKIADNLTIKNYIHELEKRVVLESDRQLAVSKKLVEYWRSAFGYDNNTFRIIPSTLNRKLSFNQISDFDALKRRGALGIKHDDVVLVYSGSSADWQ